jgi:1-acyl-sn-glycerol-3-phosphate acyltransferase
MLRKLHSLYGAFALFTLTGIGCCLVVIGSLLLPDMRRFGNWIVLTWGRLGCAALGLKLDVQGQQNMPAEGCLFLINHTSLLDILIFHAVVTKPARFGAKAELFKIPLFGWCMRRMGALKINRGEREKVIQLYYESVKRVHAGHSFVLAAEGTRLDHAGVGKDFKSGPMIFAISGQFPIVPIVMKGAHEVLPKGRLTPDPRYLGSTIKVRILEPFTTKGLTIDDRLSLKASIQARMTNTFHES